MPPFAGPAIFAAHGTSVVAGVPMRLDSGGNVPLVDPNADDEAKIQGEFAVAAERHPSGTLQCTSSGTKRTMYLYPRTGLVVQPMTRVSGLESSRKNPGT